MIAGLAGLLVAVAAGSARGAELGDGKTLYLSNCSNCHGVLAAVGHGRLDSGPLAVQVRAEIPAGLSRSPAPLFPPPSPPSPRGRLAVALPFGPTLNGVLGREAGTVAGFQYSRAFLAALRGVVWTRASLERWITDTRAWVPGAIMVYRQPDPAIRVRIIDYLEHPWASPASLGGAPTQGGEIDERASMMSSAFRR